MLSKLFSSSSFFSFEVFHHVKKDFLAAFTARFVSLSEPREIIAQTSSVEGSITSKSFGVDGCTHCPSI